MWNEKKNCTKKQYEMNECVNVKRMWNENEM